MRNRQPTDFYRKNPLIYAILLHLLRLYAIILLQHTLYLYFFRWNTPLCALPDCDELYCRGTIGGIQRVRGTIYGVPNPAVKGRCDFIEVI